MERRHLTYFLAVVDEGSISAAARRLQLSQPSVSQAIQELEDELGSKLFTRGRGMTPTSSGRALTGPARAAIRALDTARWAVSDVTELKAGRVDIACVPTRSVDPLVGLIARFRAQYPHITVSVRTAQHGAPGFDDLVRGTIELLVAEHPPAVRGFQALQLRPPDVAVVFPPDANLPDRPFRLEELPEWDWIAAPLPGAAGRAILSERLTALGFGALVPAVEIEDRHAALPLVLAGVGATFLTGKEADIARRLGAVIRPFDGGIRAGSAIYHHAHEPSPAARAFLASAQHDDKRRKPGDIGSA